MNIGADSHTKNVQVFPVSYSNSNEQLSQNIFSDDTAPVDVRYLAGVVVVDSLREPAT